MQEQSDRATEELRQLTPVSRGTPGRGKEVVMSITAYTCSPDECGRPLNDPNFCRSASGKILTEDDIYKSVAADNTLYKFGTRMVIHHPLGDIPVVVRDTGGAIKGNRLDLFVGRTEQDRAFAWGIKKMKVTVYE